MHLFFYWYCVWLLTVGTQRWRRASSLWKLRDPNKESYHMIVLKILKILGPVRRRKWFYSFCLWSVEDVCALAYRHSPMLNCQRRITPAVLLKLLKFSCSQPTQTNIYLQTTHRFIPKSQHHRVYNQFSWLNTGPAKPTADDEVGVEDAQGGLVGALLVVDCGRDDEAKWDACDALQHDQNDDQHQGAFIRHLQRDRERREAEEWEKITG